MIKIGVSNYPTNITPENFRMPFGKYKDQPLSRVPTETLLYYLQWDKLDAGTRGILEQEINKPVRQREIEALQAVVDSEEFDEDAGDWGDAEDTFWSRHK